MMFVDSEDPAASRLGQKMFCAAEDAAVNSGVFIFYFLSVRNIQDVFAPEMWKVNSYLERNGQSQVNKQTL